MEVKMAKAQDRQVAQCVSIDTYEDKRGDEKEIYSMELEGKAFTLFESKYFKAKQGGYYSPVVDIIGIGYLDKNKQPRSRPTPVVNWVEV
jgi:hypothetical protein